MDQVGNYRGVTEDGKIAMPLPKLTIKSGAKTIPALQSAAWMRKQHVAVKFTDGWHVGSVQGKKAKSKKKDDKAALGDRMPVVWWVAFEDGTYQQVFNEEDYGVDKLWVFVKRMRGGHGLSHACAPVWDHEPAAHGPGGD